MTSAELFDLAMRLTDAGATQHYVDSLIYTLCKIFDVPFPPTNSGSPAAC